MKYLSMWVAFIFLLPLVIIPKDISSQSFDVSSSRDTVLLGNYFTLEISINNLEGEFDLPDLNNLGQVMGPSTQFSTSIINGVSTSQKNYSYSIKPIQAGTLVIPEMILTTADSLYQSDLIVITVLNNPNGLIQSDVSKPNIFGRSAIPHSLRTEINKENKSKTLKNKLKKI